MNVLEVTGLTKTFMRGDKRKVVLNQLDLSIKEGDFVNIIGRSGSGKSTFVNLISGVMIPDEGEILIEGQSILNLSDDDMSKIRNEKIGYVPQGMGSLPNLTVYDNIRLPYYLGSNDGDIDKKVEELMSILGILDLKNQFPKQLSGGELKRMLIARALINDPKLLIADEPTADLDIETTKEVLELIKDINKKGTTVIIITHELEILSYGNRVMKMIEGKLEDV
ncbi:ABC transporter ATP-binding protein [Gottschalkia acidurici 9a]|uniref:ABC transporter ATP-binding protein n=1 Tax=Gottschalkia acidurici (strain ATCC 7906 / DSM 604 / BCRC 14475 / CIP 104303 / KCTC 5404 / NCIMB 10678 / 9a) TaxID=1128398 RepID=K0B0E1_GOTA9|nr:ABC transporter ATP-binding protein [Gottschalkia acidurici]AFS78999.1 ABC transporter ATP-binding protein [Gottschalkia acidurici 9a]